MTGEFSVKRPVKLALKVLDAHADRKRLRLEVNAVFMQREEGSARRMTTAMTARSQGMSMPSARTAVSAPFFSETPVSAVRKCTSPPFFTISRRISRTHP